MFNCDEAEINKFVEDLILDQERKRMEEENPKIKENYVIPKGNLCLTSLLGVMISHADF
jgi:hypothetical protein